MFIERATIQKNERAIVVRNGQFARILEPGRYWLFVWPLTSLEIEIHGLSNPQLRGRWGEYLAGKRPDIIAAHFTLIETDDSQIAMIFVDGELFQVLLPGKRELFWKNAATVTAEKLSVIDTPELPTSALTAWERVQSYTE